MFEILLGLDQCKNSQFTFHWGFSLQAAWQRWQAGAGGRVWGAQGTWTVLTPPPGTAGRSPPARAGAETRC